MASCEQKLVVRMGQKKKKSYSFHVESIDIRTVYKQNCLWFKYFIVGQLGQKYPKGLLGGGGDKSETKMVEKHLFR